MKIISGDGVSTGALATDILSNNWRENLGETRPAGDSWLAGGNSALLAVPSVPSPESLNYLFNPRHADANGLTVEWCKWMTYDKRLFHTR